jgi:hypothetical protein
VAVEDRRLQEGVVVAVGRAVLVAVRCLSKEGRAVPCRRREGEVEDGGMEATEVIACNMNMGVRVAQRIRRELVTGKPPTLSMAMVCSGLAMFARATTVAVIVTQISVQIVAPAMAVVILEEILGATTTGDSRILAMEEGMTQTVVLIIVEVYQLENNNWLKRQQRLWRDNL